MEADDVRNVDENEMRQPMAETIDICMERLCRFVVLPNETVENGVMTVPQRLHLEHLYKTLLKAFEKFIFPTHKTNHVQFIMFYFCSFQVRWTLRST